MKTIFDLVGTQVKISEHNVYKGALKVEGWFLTTIRRIIVEENHVEIQGCKISRKFSHQEIKCLLKGEPVSFENYGKFEIEVVE